MRHANDWFHRIGPLMNRRRLGCGERPRRIRPQLRNREGQSAAKSFAIEVKTRGADEIVRYDTRDQFAPETRLDLSLNRRSIGLDPSETHFSAIGSPSDI